MYQTIVDMACDINHVAMKQEEAINAILDTLDEQNEAEKKLFAEMRKGFEACHAAIEEIEKLATGVERRAEDVNAFLTSIKEEADKCSDDIVGP